MTTKAQERSRLAGHRKLAAALIYDAKIKEFDAACIVGVPAEDVRAAAHSALDALLDATREQWDAFKAEGSAAA